MTAVAAAAGRSYCNLILQRLGLFNKMSAVTLVRSHAIHKQAREVVLKQVEGEGGGGDGGRVGG